MINIELPPLRARPSDIPLLAHTFLDQVCEDARREVTGFTPDAIVALERYHWPGNVRELQNVVERAVLLGKEHVITLADLPADVRGATNVLVNHSAGTRTLKEALEGPERQIILERARIERLEPQHDGRSTRHQPHDALQEDEAPRAGRWTTGVDLISHHSRSDGLVA